MYGGVSLAVYMNGMAQELLALVRAAQARKVLAAVTDPPDWAREQAVQNPYMKLLDHLGVDVVIDVISGTSAGGLNGLILGKALACGSPDLGGLTELWKDQAQIYKLATYDKDPRTPLSGQLIQDELAKVMADLSLRGDPDVAAMCSILDVFITATDVRGHRWVRRDRLNQRIEGLAHRYLFRLKKRTRDPKMARGYDHNDFVADGDNARQARVDRLLAKIGQATSAFPGAFPPVRIGRKEAEEAKVDVMRDVDNTYADGIWFSDGGILANRPFEPVLQTIFERWSITPVRRVVAFLEPDPAVVSVVDQTEPDMIETALAAVTLPMDQDILENLDHLEQENRRRRDLLRLVERLDDAAAGGRRSRGPSFLDVFAIEQRAALQGPLADVAAASFGPPVPVPSDGGGTVLKSYYRLRADRLREWLEATFDRALEGLKVHDKAQREAAVRLVLKQASIPRSMPALASFLEQFDTEYHARRVHHMLSSIHARYGPGAEPADAEHMEEMLKHLWGVLDDWRNAAWMMGHAGRLGAQPDPWAAVAQQLDQAFAAFVAAAASPSPAAEAPARAREAWEAVAACMATVREQTARLELDAFNHAQKALPLKGGALDYRMLARLREDFISRDVMLFPLRAYAVEGEWDQVGLYRLCPGAAHWTTRTPREKLTGEGLGHFAAFLDERWRSNDILWGRLDAAELLTRMILTEAGETETPAPVQETLTARRRQILMAFPDLIDLRGEVHHDLPQLSLKERATQAYDLLTRGQVAASAMPPEQAPTAPLERISDATMKRYLEARLKVGQEKVSDLPPRRLAGEILILLHNTVHALEKPAPAFMLSFLHRSLTLVLRPMNWIARLLLIPRPGLAGLVQGNAAPLMTLLGLVLIALQLTGGLTLNTGGWAFVVVMLAPQILSAIFRPTLFWLVVTGLLALGAAVAVWPPLHDAVGPLSIWLAPLGSAWIFFCCLFGALLVARLLTRSPH